MNYRHQYHAGNFADVLKHTVLISLLQALSQKEKPWCYLDTHAGRGLYDLFSTEAQKTKEFQTGVKKIFSTITKISSITPITSILEKYHSVLEQSGYPHYYPGSPLIAYHGLRPQDRLVLIEKHPEEAQVLKTVFATQKTNSPTPAVNLEKNISIHQQDGYQSIKAHLPPKERRGLILIDPPFEQSNEWQNIIDALKTGLQRFSSGVYAVWYPIKVTSEVASFHRALHQLSLDLNCGDILIAELCIYPEDVAQGLKGAGMAIINPPWQIDKTLNELLNQLFNSLSVDNSAGKTTNKSLNIQGRFDVKWL